MDICYCTNLVDNLICVYRLLQVGCRANKMDTYGIIFPFKRDCPRTLNCCKWPLFTNKIRILNYIYFIPLEGLKIQMSPGGRGLEIWFQNYEESFGQEVEGILTNIQCPFLPPSGRECKLDRAYFQSHFMWNLNGVYKELKNKINITWNSN